jgi:hypothetical protein
MMAEEYKGVKIPTTGSDWQLYTTSMACSGAARKLTAALKRSFRIFDKYVHNRPVVHAAADAYYAEGGVYEKMAELAEFGASDTEPRCVAQNAMESYVNMKVYGTADAGSLGMRCF